MTAVLDALIVALRDLHRRVETFHGSEGWRAFCGHCQAADPHAALFTRWPCPTIALVDIMTRGLR